jgi:hypothetical protein
LPSSPIEPKSPRLEREGKQRSPSSNRGSCYNSPRGSYPNSLIGSYPNSPKPHHESRLAFYPTSETSSSSSMAGHEPVIRARRERERCSRGRSAVRKHPLFRVLSQQSGLASRLPMAGPSTARLRHDSEGGEGDRWAENESAR